MNILATILMGVIAIGSYFFPQASVWDKIPAQFGSTNFPSSLDSLTNPGATDSVSTVSHSGQHSNANDAIEAIEAKLGTGASTAVANSIFVGNGAGTSLFSTHATATAFTGTNLTSTGLSTFGQFLSLASSTIVGGLTITGNSTTTNSTSTIGAFTNFATSTKWYGGGLSTCSGSDFLQWTGGVFGCASVSSNAALGYGSSTPVGGTTNYKAKTFSMINGQTVMWWGQCSRGSSNSIAAAYRTSNDAGTTTVNSASIGAAQDLTTIMGFFNATTTYSVTVEVTTSGCDQEGGIFLQAILMTTSSQ